jgi:hypothetical protein
MKKSIVVTGLLMALFICWGGGAYGAYHHEGESDAANFLTAYPSKAGTKLDNCNLCHRGGNYMKYDTIVELGSCQWCHRTYGYDGAGEIGETMNAYGSAYMASGQSAQAIALINDADSDADGYTNAEEIAANAFPGDAEDHPDLTTAPFKIYTLGQLEALGAHKQFMLMNTSRSGDFYAEYTGVPIKKLLDDAGILPSATGIWVYAPDGWGQDHPLAYNAALDMYHVYGNVPGESYQYPPATYYWDAEADTALNADDGWCDYSAPSCVGRSHGTAISVDDGLKAILAYKREGAYLDAGVLNDENKLDGEGPYRVVVPQKYVNAPDQSSKSDAQNVTWPYTEDWDHNAGSCSRAATIIKVEPLPSGMTDIDILEAGWANVDQKKIIVYGAIDGTDSNGNGVLDSEEGTGDFDGDGKPDCEDFDTASVRHPNGIENVVIHTSKGSLSAVACLEDVDPSIPQSGKPSRQFPFGVNKFLVTDLTAGDAVTMQIKFPAPIPTTAKYYKVNAQGQWVEVPFGSNDGDDTITLTLTDGDAQTDGDGLANGTIVDPGGITTETPASTGGSSSSDGCFISSMF